MQGPNDKIPNTGIVQSLVVIGLEKFDAISSLEKQDFLNIKLDIQDFEIPVEVVPILNKTEQVHDLLQGTDASCKSSYAKNEPHDFRHFVDFGASRCDIWRD